MLVDVESRQPQRQLVLQLRGEPLLHHVVAALEEENIFILYTNILSLNSKLNIFVKLREREGQRVDKGRSLKGHL